MKKNYFTIREYGKLYRNETEEKPNYTDNGNIELPAKVFDEIENYVTSNKSNNDFDDAVVVLQLGYEKKRKFLKAKNYVGILQTHSGITIEILPKIYFAPKNTEESKETEIEKTRKIFLKMLKTLKDSPFKKLNLSSIKSDKIPLFEIFILMFIEELFILVHRGIKSDYVTKQDNEYFLKGKLLIKENIKFNFAHKERFYVVYDEFIQNRPENRLLKTTIAFLLKISKFTQNQAQLRQLLYVFDDISFSANIVSDFSNVRINRLNKDYDILLKWCAVFLKDKGFTNFKGNDLAFAMLFPMEKIFESYVAKIIKDNNSDWSVSTQDKEHYLVEKPETFRLKPDIVMRKDNEIIIMDTEIIIMDTEIIIMDTEIIIMDTKWKNLDNQCKNHGISQSDMYQMYAYGKKYSNDNSNVKQIYLIYPYNENFRESEFKEHMLKYKCNECISIAEYKFDDNLSVNILLWRFD